MKSKIASNRFLYILFCLTFIVSCGKKELEDCLEKENFQLLSQGIETFENILKDTYSNSKPMDSLYVEYSVELTRYFDTDKPVFKHQAAYQFLAELRQKGKLNFFWTNKKKSSEKDELYQYDSKLENYYANKTTYLECLKNTSNTSELKTAFETLNISDEISYSVAARSLYLPEIMEAATKDAYAFKALVAFHFYYEIILNYVKLDE